MSQFVEVHKNQTRVIAVTTKIENTLDFTNYLETILMTSNWGNCISYQIIPVYTKWVELAVFVINSNSLHCTWHNEVVPTLLEAFDKIRSIKISFELVEKKSLVLSGVN